MALLRWQQNITDNAGNVLAGASVEVRDEGTGALVNLFEDIDGITSKGNPLTTDSSGYAFAYMSPGRFKITATSGAFSFSWRDVRLANDFSDLDSRINSRVIRLNDMTSFQNVAAVNLVDNYQFVTRGYLVGSSVGGDPWHYDSGRSKGDHDGITIVSRTVPWDGDPATLPSFRAGTGETDPGGTGVFVRSYKTLSILDGGALGDDAENTTPLLEDISAITDLCLMPSDNGEIYRFGTTPTLPETFTALVFDESAISNRTINQVNGILISKGVVSGSLTADELRNKRIEVVAGTIRQNSVDRTKWDFIKDANHEPIGVDDTVQAVASGSMVTVNFLKTYSRVLSLVCNSDETLANALNLTVGASVGLSLIEIKAACSVTLSANVYFDGAAWQVDYGPGQGGTTDHNININTITWDGVNDWLRLDHDFLPGYDISVVPYLRSGGVIGPAFRPELYSTTNAFAATYATRVRFIDPAAPTVFAGTEDTKMSFILRKSYNEGLLLDGTFGTDALDLDKGNIWFYGIFEV